ncbi:hypothetical protein ACS0TY_017881 [Phlomoides rotata]
MLNLGGVVGVEPNGRSGGLALFWSSDVVCNLRSFSIGHIDVSLSWLNSSWRFTGVYGNPSGHLRKHSWDLMRKLYSLPTGC